MKTIIMLLVVILPTSLWSQDIGDYVRVKVEDKTIKGTIKKMSSKSMLLKTARRKQVVSLKEIEQLEKRISNKSHWKKGAAYGFLVGGGLGSFALYSLSHISLSGDGPTQETQNEALIAGLFIGGIPSALIGSVVGLMVRDEKWAIIEKPYKTARLQIIPAGLRASLLF